MLKRIQSLVTLSLIFLSCNNANRSVTDSTLRSNFEDIYHKYNYSQKGFDAIAMLFRYAGDKDVSATVYYYDYASRYYCAKGDYPGAGRYADSMLHIVNQPAYETSLVKERVKANINKADALYYMKRYQDCYYYYCNGMAEANKANDEALTQNLYQHLSMFLYEEGDYAKAIWYYRQLLADVKGINHTYARLMNNQGVLDNMGISFLKENNRDSATTCFTKAILAIQDASLLQPDHQDECRLALGVVYGNLAQAYVLAHRYREAETLYSQSIAINRQPGYANENALMTQAHLAEMYHEENNLPLLYETLENVKAGLDSVPNSQVFMQWNYLMSRYYTLVQQPADALIYLEQYQQLKDDYDSNRETANESNLFDQMKLMQSKYSISLLKKDNEMKEAYLWIASILFTLVFTIAILLFIYAKKKKKSVEELTLLNNEIQQKQALLEVTLTELEKQNIEKQHILHVVAHDLRNPLSAIHTLAGVVVSEYENEDDNREFLEIIRSACMESNQLINSILEIAENTDVKYNYEPVEVNVLLSNCMDLLQMKAKEKNQHIGLITAQETGIMYADTEKLNRVVSNLVTNAIKFSPSGSYIEVEASISDQYITIQIKDNGIGIPEKYHDSIFNMFTEAKRAGTNGEKTFGLGLSISKQIVEKHHGRIWFESAVNKGTTFFVQLSRLEDVIKPDDVIIRKIISV